MKSWRDKYKKKTGHHYCIKNRPHRPTELYTKYLENKLDEMEKYVQHKMNCEIRLKCKSVGGELIPTKCTCGLDKLLKEQG